MAETCSKILKCGENNLIAEKSWFELHLCFPFQLSASVDLSVSVVTSAGEERLGVTHVYAWDVMGLCWVWVVSSSDHTFEAKVYNLVRNDIILKSAVIVAY